MTLPSKKQRGKIATEFSDALNIYFKKAETCAANNVDTYKDLKSAVSSLPHMEQ